MANKYNFREAFGKAWAQVRFQFISGVCFMLRSEWLLLKPEMYMNEGARFIAPGFRYLNGRDESRPYIPVVGQLLRLTQVFYR